jgi:hypothetical protein
MTRQWVNGPGFVEWLYSVRPQTFSGDATELLGETNMRGLCRAKQGGSLKLEVADRICCVLDLHIDSEMPEDLWVDGPLGRARHPRAEEAAQLLAEGRSIRNVAEVTGMCRSSVLNIRRAA